MLEEVGTWVEVVGVEREACESTAEMVRGESRLIPRSTITSESQSTVPRCVTDEPNMNTFTCGVVSQTIGGGGLWILG